MKTQSLVLIASDPDSLFGFVHWILYNLPPDTNSISAGIAKQQLPAGSQQGLNGGDAIGYKGPCPPGKSSHRYFFTLYALDARLALPAAGEKQLSRAMEGHILAAGQLMGRYHH